MTCGKKEVLPLLFERITDQTRVVSYFSPKTPEIFLGYGISMTKFLMVADKVEFILREILPLGVFESIYGCSGEARIDAAVTWYEMTDIIWDKENRRFASVDPLANAPSP